MSSKALAICDEKGFGALNDARLRDDILEISINGREPFYARILNLRIIDRVDSAIHCDLEFEKVDAYA